MNFFNETNRDVQLGVYYTDDRLYWWTFFDWGMTRTLHPGYNNFPTPGTFAPGHRWPEKFQVIFWVDGQQVGPKVCGRAGATITKDKVILNGQGLVVEGGELVRKIDIKDRIDHIVVVMRKIAHLITYWGGFMPTVITSRRGTYRFSQ